VSGRTVLLLVGSAKRSPSTSEALGAYLVDKLEERGFEGGTVFLHKSLRTTERTSALLRAVDGADIVILSFPLYVDCLPSQVIAACERIASSRTAEAAERERALAKRKADQRLVALVNSGFPEPYQSDVAVAVCRRFAREAGFRWSGGLRLGNGAWIRGRALADVPDLTSSAMKALDLTAAALSDGLPVPDEAVQLMARPLAPLRTFLRASNLHWRREARKHGVADRLRDRPYQRTEER
jgi:hypothetical protein